MDQFPRLLVVRRSKVGVGILRLMDSGRYSDLATFWIWASDDQSAENQRTTFISESASLAEKVIVVAADRRKVLTVRTLP